MEAYYVAWVWPICVPTRGCFTCRLPRWDPINENRVKDMVTSPCIDAGEPTSLVDFEPFPNGGIINMGAYGGTVEASMSSLSVIGEVIEFIPTRGVPDSHPAVKPAGG